MEAKRITKADKNVSLRKQLKRSRFPLWHQDAVSRANKWSKFNSIFLSAHFRQFASTIIITIKNLKISCQSVSQRALTSKVLLKNLFWRSGNVWGIIEIQRKTAKWSVKVNYLLSISFFTTGTLNDFYTHHQNQIWNFLCVWYDFDLYFF